MNPRLQSILDVGLSVLIALVLFGGIYLLVAKINVVNSEANEGVQAYNFIQQTLAAQKQQQSQSAPATEAATISK